MPGKRRAHYGGSYQLDAKRLTAMAYANPATRCARCGRTLAEHPYTKTGKPPSWDAGHVLDGVPGSPLQPEVASCGRSAGATMGNKQRAPLRVTEDW